MKIFYILPFLLMGTTALQAQVIEDSNPSEAMEQTKKELKKEAKQQEKALEIKSDAVADAKAAYEKAQEEYKSAQQALVEARQQEMTADNEVEKARVAMRQAKLGLSQAQKKASPIKIERYNPMVNPIYEEMSKGSNPGLATFIEGSEVSGLFNVFSKNVDKEFKDYMKQFSSSKVKKQKGELFFDNIMIPQMSASTMDLFVDFVKQDNGVGIRTYFNDGANFLDFNNDEAASTYAKSMMDQFARYMRTKNLEAEIEGLEKDLDKNYKDLENNKSDITKAREDIQKAKTSITEKTNENSSFEGAIDDLNEKIEITRKKLSKVN